MPMPTPAGVPVAMMVPALRGHALRKLGNDMVNVEDLQADVGVLPLCR